MKNYLFGRQRLIQVFVLALSMSGLNLSCSKEEEPIIITPPVPSGPQDQEISTSINSINIGESYPVKIYIPKEYEDNKNLPVIYLTDGLFEINGNPFFDEVVYSIKSVGLLAILVAVGDKTGLERERDFLANGCAGGYEEGFNNFHKFMTEEVISYIDDRYESSPSSRTLIGGSHGGNFAYNAFLREKPDSIIFHNFIAVDPSSCDFSILEQHLDNMDFPEDSNFKMHFSQAEFPVEPIYSLFKEKDFPFLELDFKNYDNETHQSVSRPSIQRGLKFIYDL